MSDVANRILNEIAIKKISSYRLAKLMDRERSQIWREIKTLKGGGSVTLETLKRYAEVLNIKI